MVYRCTRKVDHLNRSKYFAILSLYYDKPINNLEHNF